MKKMTDTKIFLDSSVWLGYAIGNIPETKKYIDGKDAILFTFITKL